jgi:hypothetical protein
MTVQACYNCCNYSISQEKKAWVERCAARGNARLDVAAVVAGQPVLIDAERFRNLGDKTAYIYGSPAQYHDATGRHDCATYQKKEQ